ncbi:MAG: hypothetical protein QXT72_00730 [Candidatus Micrarchaeia archaeon]
MAEEEMKEEIKESVEGEAEIAPEEDERLPFPTARVVRILKENMTKPHQIRAEVKIAANEFLGEILKDIAKEMDKEEVFTLSTEHFNKAIKKYKMIEYQQKRIERIKKLLEKQKAEVEEVIMEIDFSRDL